MINMAVCVKQVPGSALTSVDPKTGIIIRDSACNIMNPDDLHALEMAISLKERYEGSITAISMGPPCAEDVLREACALGADTAVLLSDTRFAGSDSYVTSLILSRALRILGGFDLVITGVESADGNTSSVGYQLSEFLGIPLITRIHRMELVNNEAVIERLYGHEFQKISVSLPVLLAVNKESNHARFPRLADIKTCFDRAVRVITMDEIGGRAGEYGLKGSPTVVIKSELFTHRRGRKVLEGTIDEKIDLLFQQLKKRNIITG